MKQRAALSSIVAVLASMALAKQGSELNPFVLIWLVYAVVSGVIVNTPQGESERNLVFLSLAGPTAMVCTFLYMIVFQGYAPFSGIKLMLNSTSFGLLAIVWAVTFLAIYIFSHARPLVLSLAKKFFAVSKNRAQKVEYLLNWTVRVIGLCFLIVKAFVR